MLYQNGKSCWLNPCYGIYILSPFSHTCDKELDRHSCTNMYSGQTVARLYSSAPARRELAWLVWRLYSRCGTRAYKYDPPSHTSLSLQEMIVMVENEKYMEDSYKNVNYHHGKQYNMVWIADNDVNVYYKVFFPRVFLPCSYIEPQQLKPSSKL